MRSATLAAVLLLIASRTGGAWVSGTARTAPSPAGDASVVGIAEEPPVVSASGAPPRVDRVLAPARNLPAGWQGTIDRDTGVVAQLWGGWVSAPGAVADAAIAERAAREFVSAHLGLLAPGASITDFVLVTNRLEGALRTVAFTQTWRGMRVVGGQVHVVFKADRLFVAGSQALPDVSAVITPRGPVSTARAESWITAQTKLPVVTRLIGDRVVLPIIRASGITYELADQLDIEAVGEPGRWDVYIAANGTPILRATRLSFASATLAYDAGVRRPTGTRQSYPATATAITVDSTAVTTTSTGGFSWSGSGDATVITSVTGALVQIVDEAGALATTTLTAQPNGTVRWSLATDEVGDAQISAFIHAAIAKDRARALMPSLASWLDQPLRVHVNQVGSCNALSTGDDLYFYRQSAQCENTARLADVVYHELGHSVHMRAIIAGVGAFNSSLSEGLADFFAATIVEDQGVGRGFTFDDKPVRELDPSGFERVWPEDRGTTPHQAGLILSGALWDLRSALIRKLGPVAGRTRAAALFVGVMQRSPDLVGTYLAALTTDDDDGNLGNGTPNSCAIEQAFGKHGLASSAFVTTTVGVPVVSGLSISVPVTIPMIGACPPPQVTGVQVAWHVGAGAPSAVDLVANGATWTGTIPAQPNNTVVLYTVSAILDDGSSITYPHNAADPEYQLFTGAPAEIWCERFDEDPRWTASGDPSWEWAPPGRNPQSGDPTSAFTGANVLGTDVIGDGYYPVNATTSIETPVIDVSMYDQVRLQYRRWLTVEDGTYDHATIAINGVTQWSNAAAIDGVLDHIDREWRFHDLDVTAAATDGTVQVSWSIQSDPARALGGWNLDDVCLVGIGKHAVCGDLILDEGEGCDDGNTTNGDGCAGTCSREDDTGCCSTGSSPTGPGLLGLAVVMLMVRRRRRA